jgi:alpha-D-ribose 1-methylphosphonate 5-triphosphate synthase subunit PhnL
MSADGTARLWVRGVGKRFVLHNQGATLDALRDVDLVVRAGECVALVGPSGSGKSTLLRLIHGNYLMQQGSIAVRRDGAWIEIAGAAPRTILALRRDTIGYVSQFLRVIPRVASLDIVADPLVARGVTTDGARERAALLLAWLNIPRSLWPLAPATFSGGEQQRINIARGLVADYPILLLDEPTASLDPANQEVAVELIRAACLRGAAVLGIFHDPAVRDAVAYRVHALSPTETVS